MQLSEFKQIMDAFWDNVEKQGKACRGTIQDANTVLIDGKTYPYDIAVAINCTAGKKVYCHLQNGKAVVIGS